MLRLLILLSLLMPVAMAAPRALPKLTLTSTSFRAGGYLDVDQEANSGTCGGGNQAPGFKWGKGPKGTRSYALTMYDEDKQVWHWVVVGIPASVTRLADGSALPEGAVQTQNSFRRNGYMGMCPPVGEKHTYRFTIWALKVKELNLSAASNPVTAVRLIRRNALASGSVAGVYRRQ